jgi:hypothetical protein
MKTLFAALVVTLSTAALADQPNAQPTQAQQEQQRNQGRRISTGIDATQVGTISKQKAEDVGQQVEGKAEQAKDYTAEKAHEAGQAIEQKTQEAKDATAQTVDKAADKMGIARADQGTFTASKAFTARGTLKNTGGGAVTLVREGLPNADLDVRPETIVMLDGKKVESNAIPEGSQVRAKFQLEGGEAVAVELNATSPKK